MKTETVIIPALIIDAPRYKLKFAMASIPNADEINVHLMHLGTPTLAFVMPLSVAIEFSQALRLHIANCRTLPESKLPIKESCYSATPARQEDQRCTGR